MSAAGVVTTAHARPARARPTSSTSSTSTRPLVVCPATGRTLDRERSDLIHETRRRFLVAAEHFDRGRAELLVAWRALEQHPDFAAYARVERDESIPARQRHNLVAFYHDCIRSVGECNTFEAGELLRLNATGEAERMLLDIIETAEREAAAWAAEEKRTGRKRRPFVPPGVPVLPTRGPRASDFD